MRVRIYLSQFGSADVTSLAGRQECATSIASMRLRAQRRFAVLTCVLDCSPHADAQFEARFIAASIKTFPMHRAVISPQMSDA
jgi:hypothetical protein